MKRIPVFFILLMLVLAMPVPALAEYTSLEELNKPGIRVGVPLGSLSETVAGEMLPEAEIVSYNDLFLGYTEVAKGKLDAFIHERKQMQLAIDSGVSGVRLLDEDLGTAITIAVGVSDSSDIPELKTKVNAFLAQLREDGTLDDMLSRWVVLGDEKMPDIPVPAEPTLTLTVGTAGIVPPYNYYTGNDLTGFDIELARRFADWLNADLEFMVSSFSSLIAAAKSGKADVIMSDLQISPERAESMSFSDPLYVQTQAVMVRDEAAGGGASGEGFLGGIRRSFEKTFIRDGRWELFLEGIGNTLLITVLGTVLGTLLGFGVFMLCRRGSAAANAVTRVSIRLIQGMPVVVLLMVLYYIVFGRVTVSALAVAVIGFTLTFGSSVFSLLRLGVGAVDGAQYEAACALGYTDSQAFFKVVLPQALPHILPAFQGNVIGLIKATAVVGYITVQDLTKMGDIIRSRTYEAFFPLIAVTVIYFLLEEGVGFLVVRIGRTFDFRRRRRSSILKGVKTNDKD